MSWATDFLTSSIGRKLIMGLTGIFLILFLVVHMSGNFLLLQGDGGLLFNEYAAFMTTNPLIKFISYGLYFFILLHSVLGVLLWSKNKQAKGGKYAVSASDQKQVSWASSNMAILGTLIFAFLLLHMGDFWYKMKFTSQLPFDANGNKDLYSAVETSFAQSWIVLAYLLGLLALAFHLWHGFESAFRTLGLRNKKYTPIILFIGRMYAVLIPLGFASMPLYFMFR
jgi:succinate dehydrogenase / fumarate reductase, cytochrome b subunit